MKAGSMCVLAALFAFGIAMVFVGTGDPPLVLGWLVIALFWLVAAIWRQQHSSEPEATRPQAESKRRLRPLFWS